MRHYLTLIFFVLALVPTGTEAACCRRPQRMQPQAAEHVENLCPICQEKLTPPHVALPCEHPFHQRCLQPWVQDNHLECPFCRASFSQTEAEQLQLRLPATRQGELMGNLLHAIDDRNLTAIRNTLAVPGFNPAQTISIHRLVPAQRNLNHMEQIQEDVTVLMVAAAAVGPRILQALIDGYQHTGHDVNQHTDRGHSALTFALEALNLENAELLLAAGAIASHEEKALIKELRLQGCCQQIALGGVCAFIATFVGLFAFLQITKA